MSAASDLTTQLTYLARGEAGIAFNSLNIGMNRVLDLFYDANIQTPPAPVTSITIGNEDYQLGGTPAERSTKDPKEGAPPSPVGSVDLAPVEFREPSLPDLIDFTSPAEFIQSAGEFSITPPDLTDLNGLLDSIDRPVLELATLPTMVSISIPSAPGIEMGSAPAIAGFVDPGLPQMDGLKTPTVYKASLASAPSITIPEFTTDNVPRDLTDAPKSDAAISLVDEKISLALNSTLRGYIEQTLSDWQAKWAPEFSRVSTAWTDRISEQMDASTGFTIVSDKFETDLYTRAKNRVSRETQAVIGQVSDAMRKRGFLIPPAAMNSGIAKAQQQMADNLAAQSTEIAVKRQELEYQHTRFLLELGQNVMNSIRAAVQQNVAGSIQAYQIAVGYGQSILDTVVRTYQLMFEQYKTRAELYQVDAQVYEYRLKASLATLDIYKVKLEAERVKAELSKTEVDAYVASLEGEKAKVAIYTAQLEGEKAKAEISRIGVEAYRAGLEAQKTKADIYQAQVEGEKAKAAVNQSVIEAYKARIQAEEIKIQAYVAQLQGINAVAQVEKAKVDNFEAQVRAYAATVAADETKAKVFQALIQGEAAKMQVNASLLEAYGKRVQAESAKVQGTVEANKGRVTVQQNIVEAYKAEIAAYVAENQAIAAYNDVQGRKYAADIEKYRGESTAKAAMAQAKADGMRAQLAESMAGAQLELSAKKSELEGKIELIKAYMEGEKAQAAFAEGFAQSALSGINAMASVIKQE